MVRIDSRHFGPLDIREDKVLRFPRGLVGFPDATAFCLLSLPEAAPYQWLQGVTRPDLAFIVVPMILLDPGYRLALSEAEQKLLHLKENDAPLVLGIVTVPEEVREATVNKLAPIVLNERTCLGHQVVNDKPGYRTRHEIQETRTPQAREGETYVGAYPQTQAVLDVR